MCANNMKMVSSPLVKFLFHFIIILCFLPFMESNNHTKNERSGDSNQFCLLQWNCRSRCNFDYLVQFLKDKRYQVICLQSLNCYKKDLPKLEGYFYPPVIDETEKYAKIKIAVYISNTILYKARSPPYRNADNRLYASCIELSILNETVVIVNCYYPDGVSKGKADWLLDLDPDVRWLIVGDFNSHHGLWSEKDSVLINNNEYLANTIINSNLTILNDGSITRIADRADQRCSSIDISLVSPDLNPFCSWKVLDNPLGSDHLPIELSISLSPDLINNKNHTIKYNENKARWDVFSNALASYSYDIDLNLESISQEDIDSCYSSLRNTILKAADLAIPKVKYNPHPKRLGNPWWDNSCEIAVKTKTKAYKMWQKYRKTESKETVTKLHNDYKKANIISNKTVAAAKKKYYSELINNCTNDSSSSSLLWMEIKKIKGSYNLPDPPLLHNNVLYKTNEEKAEIFADTFEKMSQTQYLPQDEQSRRKLLEENNKTIDINMNYEIPSCNNADLSMHEMRLTINAIKSGKVATGSDPISYNMIKHFPNIFLGKLLAFYKICWNSGKLPSDWKNATIVPIHKQGKPKSNPSSFRPISLTPHLGKVFERILKVRLEHFLEKKGILPLFQAGFRRGRGVTDHIVHLTSHVKRALAKRHSVVSTFFDIHRAYDSVWHYKLLHKAKLIGLGERFIRFLNSFLSNRTFRVRVNGILSTSRSTDMGVPQGSVISPTLFSLMIYDMKHININGATIAAYADDIALWKCVNCNFTKCKSKRNKVMHHFQDSVNNIVDYMRENGFLLSAEKTVFIIFTKKLIDFTGKDAVTIKINNITIYPSIQVKFLGVIFHYKLLWNRHINYLVEKARKKIALLRVLSGIPVINFDNNLIHAALGLVRSVVCYGQEVYFSAQKSDLHKLTSIDSLAFKIALGLPRWASIDKTYKEAGILPLSEYRLLHTCKYMVRARAVPNSNFPELDESNYVCREIRNKSVYMSVFDYTSVVFKECNLSLDKIAHIPLCPYPPWLTEQADIIYEFGKMTKTNSPLILASFVRELINTRFRYFLRVFTDGSVSDSSEVGAAFVVPDLKIKKRYSLTTGCSIFTAELFAIMMALTFFNDMTVLPTKIVILSDSKSALMALHNQSSKKRVDIIYENLFLIHQLIVRGCHISLMWVPGHSNLCGNEMADHCAKEAASKTYDTLICDIPFSVSEANSILLKFFWSVRKKRYLEQAKVKEWWDCSSPKKKCMNITGSIPIRNLFHRLKTNSWLGRFLKPYPVCICGDQLNIQHFLFDCKFAYLHFNFLHDTLNSNNLPKTMSSILFQDKDNGWNMTKIAINSIKNHTLGHFF